MEGLLLRGLWSKENSSLNRGDHPVHRPMPVIAATNRHAHPVRKADARGGASVNRRATTVKVARLYPVRKTDAEIHARTILRHIQLECAELTGSYVSQFDLERVYLEICDIQGWSPRHWCSVGRELGKLTDKRLVQRNGHRFRAYRIPRPARAKIGLKHGPAAISV